MIPVIPPQQAFEMLDPEQLKVGDTFTVEEELHFKINHRDLEIKEERAFFCSFLKNSCLFDDLPLTSAASPVFSPREKDDRYRSSFKLIRSANRLPMHPSSTLRTVVEKSKDDYGMTLQQTENEE